MARNRRPCNTCGKMFTPNSRWNFMCNDCQLKSIERKKEKAGKRKIKKV